METRYIAISRRNSLPAILILRESILLRPDTNVKRVFSRFSGNNQLILRMTTQGKNTVRILRWIFCIPLAFVISIMALTLLIFQRDISMRFRSSDLFTILFNLETVVFFVLPVLLSSLFAPRPKKYAALIALAIVMAFLFITFYFELRNFAERGFRSISLQIATSYMAMLAGCSIGFALSYIIFIKRGWKSEQEDLETPGY